MIAQNQTQKVQELNNLINFFFENQVKELEIKFDEPYVLTEEQYKQIFNNYDSLGGAKNDSYVIDEFVYDEEFNVKAKITVTYIPYEDKLEIIEIHAWREKGE